METAATLRAPLKELRAYLAHAAAIESLDEVAEHLARSVAASMAHSRAQAQQCLRLLFRAPRDASARTDDGDGDAAEADGPDADSASASASLLQFLALSDHASEDVRKREIAQARVKVLEVLGDVLKRYGAHAAMRKGDVVAALRQCQAIARGDWSNKVRAAALQVVIHVLKYCNALITPRDVEPAAYAEKLMYDLKFSKATQTAKGTMLEVLGHLASLYPEHLAGAANAMMDWIEDTLDKQFAAATPEMLLVKGCLVALARLLGVDTQRYAENADKRTKMHMYLNNILAATVQGRVSRYGVTKAALLFLTLHGAALKEEIGKNGFNWFGYMKFCTAHDNKTIKESAFPCADAVLAVVGDYLAEARDDVNKKTLNRMLKEVLPVLGDGDASAGKVAFALQTIAFVAPAIQLYLGEKGFLKIEERLLKYGEGLLVLDERATAVRWSVFSCFLQCAASFATETRSIPIDDTTLDLLGDVLCHVLDAYPRVLWRTKAKIVKPIMRLFSSLSRCNAAVELLADRVIYHTLLLTVSHATDMSDTVVLYHPETGNVETRMLFAYEGLWTSILRNSGQPNMRDNLRAVKNETRLGAMNGIEEILLDSLMKNILQVVQTLDLSYEYGQGTGTGNHTAGYQPAVARDHSIVLNLTEFLERLLPKLDAKQFETWIPTLFRLSVEKTQQLPLVSAFYRMIRVLAASLNDLNWFSDSGRPLVHDTHVQIRQEYEAFVSVLVGRLRFLKDELLVAAAGSILAAPAVIVNAEDFAEALLPVLEIGRSYHPAATLAIASLEKWQCDCPAKIQTILHRIIPGVLPYLEGNIDVDDDDQEALKEVQDSNEEVSSFQRRLLVFLGKAGSEASLIAVRSDVDAGNEGKKFRSRSLMFPLNLADAAIDLVLDDLLEYVGKAASVSADRRIKAAACELYQGLICFLSGKTATHPHASGTKSQYYGLWRSVFPLLLQLATDTEKICRSLFEPLLFQLARWFSNASDTFPYENGCMLDAFVVGLSDPSNTARREIGARCLAVCLTSSSQAGDRRSQERVQEIFERLFSLCRHPGVAQRVGAATAISIFLRSLKEEDSAVISVFALQCLQNLLYALKMCETDVSDGRSGPGSAQDIITKAAMKLQRAVCRFPDLFMGAKAKGMQLGTLTEWLFKQSPSPQHAYRQVCRTLFMAFSPLVSGAGCKQWIQDYCATNNVDDLGTLIAPSEWLVVATSEGDSTWTVLDKRVQWIDRVSASVEACTWCSEVLGVDSSSLMGSGEPSMLKRKRSESDQSDVGSGGGTAIAWALKELLAPRTWEEIIGDELKMEHSIRSRLRAAYVRAIQLICNAWSITMRPTYQGVLRVHVCVDEDGMRDMFVRVLFELLSRAGTWRQAELDSFISDIDRFVLDAVASTPHFKESMKQAVNKVSGQLLLKWKEPEGEMTDSDRSRAIHYLRLLSKFYHQGLSTSLQVDVLLEISARGMNQAASCPEARVLALEAIKIACWLGWDVMQLIDKTEERKRFALVHNEIISLLPMCGLWKRISSSLAPSDVVPSTRRLSTLVEVVTLVATRNVFATGSQNTDDFVTHTLPQIKPMLEFAKANNPSQKRRLVLEAILQLVKVMRRCSRSMMDWLQLNPMTDIRATIVEMLQMRELSHLLKSDVLEVLAELGPGSTEDDVKNVADALTQFVVNEFPIVSTDVKFGSRDYDIFQLLLGRILLVVKKSRCIGYLRVLQSTLAEGESHMFVDDVKQSLSEFAETIATPPALSDENPIDSMIQLTDILMDAGTDVAVRRAELNHVLVPLLEMQRPEVLSKYYLHQATPSSVTMLSKLATIIANSGDIVSNGAFFTAAVAFTLVELLFRLVDPEAVRTEINAAFLGHNNGKGREFTMLVCKCASKFVTKRYDDATETTKLACCEAYGCLLTAVARTQKQEKFFDQILFQDSLWPNIVDTTLALRLSAETPSFDRIPLSSFSAATLKFQLDKQRGSNAGGRTRRDSSSVVQFLTGSSLSQSSDIGSSTISTLQVDAELATRETAYSRVEIELDSLNQHRCMIPLLRVLVQMKEDFSATWDPHAMPSWMKKVFDVASSPMTALAIRLFLAKVVLNVQDVFAPYASQWAIPIIETMLDVTAESSDKQPEFHYLLRDTCQLFTESWTDVSLVSVGTPSRFIDKLIQLAPTSPNNLIVQDNVVLVTQLILAWKAKLQIDTRQVVEMLFVTQEDARLEGSLRYVALQVISAMMTAGIVHQFELGMLDEGKTVEQGLLDAVSHKRASVYTVAAEVAGLWLHSHDAGRSAFLAKLVELITARFNEDDYGRFLALLRSVSMHQPAVLDSSMLHRLSFVLPKVVGIDRWALPSVECLLFAMQNVDVRGEVIVHCQQLLGRYVRHRNPRVHAVALRLLELIVEHADEETLTRLRLQDVEGGMGLFELFKAHCDVETRQLAFNVAIKFHAKISDQGQQEQLRNEMLIGFADEDASIRDTLASFWRTANLLPVKCDDRVVALFRSLFASNAAGVWILYATNLLLGMTATDDAFETTMFANPLMPCEFHEASIDAGWEAKDQTMMPIFSVEMDKFSANATSQLAASLSTQDPAWSSSTQTFDASASIAQSQLVASTLSSQSALTQMLSIGSQSDGGSRARRRRFVKQKTMDPQSGGMTGGYRHRNEKTFFTERYYTQKKNEMAMRNRQRKARTQQVSLRRTYRFGDYPDIQIKPKDILDPMMVLCRTHAATSSLILASLLPSIVSRKNFIKSSAVATLGEHVEKAMTEARDVQAFVTPVQRMLFSCAIKHDELVSLFDVQTSVIRESSLASQSYQTGMLLLEAFLNHTSTASSSSGSAGSAQDWDALYKVLATMQKSNLLPALGSKCCSIDETKVALQARLSGDLPSAVASYRKAESILESEMELQPDDASSLAGLEARRCHWERLACLETLNQWDKLEREFSDSEANDFEDLWSDESPYLEQGLGHCLRLMLGLTTSDSADGAALKALLGSVRKDPVRAGTAQAHFAVELSLANLVLDDSSEAQIVLERFYPKFLQRWNASSSVTRVTRLQLMQSLASAVQMEEMLSIFSDSRSRADDHQQQRLISRWYDALPPYGEGSMHAWSQFFLVQRVCSEYLRNASSEEGLISDSTRSLLRQKESQLMLQYAGAAVKNDILSLGSKYLKEFREMCNAENLSKVSPLMVDVFVSHVLKLAERQLQRSNAAAPSAISAEVEKTVTRYYQTATKMFDNSDILDLNERLAVDERVVMGALEAHTFRRAAEFYLAVGFDADQTGECLSRAVDVYRRSCSAIPAVDDNAQAELTPARESAFNRCRLSYVEFLVDILFGDKSAEWMAHMDRKAMVQALTENVLNGMASGDQECSNYFPQLCELIPPFPDIVQVFEERVLASVPTWTYLRWASQLLALSSGSIGPTIVRILEQMAREYPDALFYDFKVTTSGASRPELGKLAVLLANPVMDKFVEALKRIHHPELRLKEGLRDVSKLFEDNKASEAKERMQQVWAECFALCSSLLGDKIGQYNRSFARDVKKNMEKILGRDGTNVTLKSVTAAREWIGNYFSVTPGKYGITKDMKARLCDFAEWLDEFDHTQCRLELPGQYTSHWRKPEPSMHALVLSFEASMSVLASKQLPKRLTLHCSDEKDYTFLVKGGEDLRLDQRIEQLFGVMNDLLRANSRCRDRNFHTRTYQVIPMTTEIGMLEWMDGTSTLKGVIETQLEVDPRCADLQSNKRMKLQLFNTTAARNYEAFLMKQRGATFAAKVAAPTKPEVVANFSKVQAMIPADLLRRQLLQLGATFEDFITVRDEFATSLVVFSACSYVLGIGDRHLDNYLLDERNGRVVGIDFGVSFGAGASVLPCPELIPFRYTRQMEAVFAPYDSTTLLLQDMQVVLEALRDKKQVIQSVMNVFLHEPLLDWQQSTTTFQNEIFIASDNSEASLPSQDTQESETEASSGKRASSKRSKSSRAAAAKTAWLPDVKVAIARRKLDGFSPRLLLKEELAQNPHLGKQLKSFQAMVDAAVASEPSMNAMSPLDQAQELLALATAPDLLGRTFHGWMPWL